MATQNGPIIWEKTFDCGVSFYKRLGRGCVRMKSNLTGERWRKDPAFEGSRLSAACMALGSQLGSAVYQTIPLQHRRYSHYKELVGIAQKMLRQGYNLEQVNKVLHFAVARYLRKLQAADPNWKPKRSPFAATHSLKSKPAYTALTPHQQIVPQFTAPTTSIPAFKRLHTIMSPRGSPIPISRILPSTILPFHHPPSTIPSPDGYSPHIHIQRFGPKISKTAPKKNRNSSPAPIFCPLAFQ